MNSGMAFCIEMVAYMRQDKYLHIHVNIYTCIPTYLVVFVGDEYKSRQLAPDFFGLKQQQQHRIQ